MVSFNVRGAVLNGRYFSIQRRTAYREEGRPYSEPTDDVRPSLERERQ